MGRALSDIIGYMPLTESLRTVASGIPNPFPSEFFTVKPRNRIVGDRARYIKVKGSRKTAKFIKYGSPALRRPLEDLADAKLRMLHSVEEFQIDPLVMQQLQAFESYTQDEGMEWLEYQIKEAAVRHTNSRVIAVASTLRFGQIYIDVDGNILPSSGSAELTVDFEVPATHQNQVNGNITGSWVNANHDLLGDLRNLQQFALQETGMLFDTALYGVNIPGYIQRNNFSVEYLARNPSANDTITQTGQIPSGFGGIKNWIPVYTSFWESDDGTVNEIWNDDLLVLIPSLSQPDKMNWWDMFEGSYLVPKSLDIQATAQGAHNIFDTVFGLFSYAVPSHNPPGWTFYEGDTFLPALRNGKAIVQATVAF